MVAVPRLPGWRKEASQARKRADGVNKLSEIANLLLTRSQKMLGVRFRECLSSKVPQIYYNIIFIRFSALKYCPCLSGL